MEIQGLAGLGELFDMLLVFAELSRSTATQSGDGGNGLRVDADRRRTTLRIIP